MGFKGLNAFQFITDGKIWEFYGLTHVSITAGRGVKPELISYWEKGRESERKRARDKSGVSPCSYKHDKTPNHTANGHNNLKPLRSANKPTKERRNEGVPGL